MSTNLVVKVSYPLFGIGGVVNPVLPTSRGSRELRVLDETGVWRHKQASSFDGGWRWFRSDGIRTVIYNKRLHPRAFADIEDLEFEGAQLDAELILNSAQIRTFVDHNAYLATEFVVQSLRMFTDNLISQLGETL